MRSAIMQPMLRLMLRLLAVVAVVATLSACQVDARVTVDIAADGSGTVRVEAVLDAEASAVFLELGESLVVGDLAEAGWTIDGVQDPTDVPFTIVAIKQVGSAQRLAEVLDEIAGSGVFSNVSLVASSEFAEHRQALTFDLDLRRGWELFASDGSNTIDLPAVREAVGDAAIDDVLAVAVDASVIASDMGPPVTASVAPRFDDGAPTELQVVAVSEQSTARLFRWIAYSLGVLFLLSIALGLIGSRLERRAERLRKRAPVLAIADGSVDDDAKPAAPVQPPEIRLVVVEPLTVLYRQREALEKYLVPFVRHNGGTASVEVIGEALDQVRSGNIGTAEMWAWAGVVGESEEIDRVFVTMRWLRDETAVLLRELAHRRLPIAAVSNDAAAWSLAMRDRDQLHTVWPWLVSSEIGAPTTDEQMFDTLQRQSGVVFANCVYVDTDLVALDIAAELGMQTVLFRPDRPDDVTEGLDRQSSTFTHRVCTDLLHLLTPSRRPL